MKHILLAIHSSSHKIFQNNTIALIEGYKKIIKKHHLPIDIVSFCGQYDNSEHNYIETIKSDILDKRVADVLFDVMQKLVDKDYDIIIKTNTNTVINLPLVCMFCNSSDFNESVIYSNICYQAYGDFNILFPSGMFTMASNNIWKQICGIKNTAIEFSDIRDGRSPEMGVYHTEEYSTEKLVWSGYSDEFLIGVCMKLLNINMIALLSSTISMAKREFFSYQINNDMFSFFDDIDPKYLCINCKIDIECDLELNTRDEIYRIEYEHYMIQSLCKIFEIYNPQFEDLENLITSINYYDQI